MCFPQGVAYVKHLLDRSSEFISRSKGSVSVQLAIGANQFVAVDARVSALSQRVSKLEETSDYTQAAFAEEQDGRINAE
jgi:hypothetical protein